MELNLTYSNDRYHPWLGGYAEMRIDSDTFDVSRVASKSGVPVLMNHDYRQHVGMVKSVDQQKLGDGTVEHSAVVEIPESVPGNSDLIAKFKAGMVRGVSVGAGIDNATIVRDNRGETAKRAQLSIRGASLNEISLTAVPVVSEVGVSRLSEGDIVMDEFSIATGGLAENAVNRILGAGEPAPAVDGVSELLRQAELRGSAVESAVGRVNAVELAVAAVTQELVDYKVQRDAEVAELKAKIADIQYMPRRVETVDTPNRRPISLGRYATLELMDNGNQNRITGLNGWDFTIEESERERQLPNRHFHNRDSLGEIPFAVFQRSTYDRAKLRATQGIQRAVDVGDIDEDVPGRVMYPAEGQLALDTTISPILGRMDMQYGLRNAHKLSWFASKPAGAAIADAGNFTLQDYSFENYDAVPKTLQVVTEIGRTALNFDDGTLERLFESAAYRLMNNLLVNQILIGTGASNQLTGVGRQSGITRVDFGTSSSTTPTTADIKQFVTEFIKLKGDGGRGGRKETALIASTSFFEPIRKLTVTSSGTDTFVWTGLAEANILNEIPGFYLSGYDRPTISSTAAEIDALIVNLFAIWVGLWGTGMEIMQIPNPTAAKITYALVLSVDATCVAVAENALFVARAN